METAYPIIQIVLTLITVTTCISIVEEETIGGYETTAWIVCLVAVIILVGLFVPVAVFFQSQMGLGLATAIASIICVLGNKILTGFFSQL